MEPLTMRRLAVGCGACLGVLALALVLGRGTTPLPAAGSTGAPAAPRPHLFTRAASPSMTAGPAASPETATPDPATPSPDSSTPPPPATDPPSSTTPASPPTPRRVATPGPAQGPTPPQPPATSPSSSPTATPTSSSPTPTASQPTPPSPSGDILKARIEITDPGLAHVCNTERTTYTLAWNPVSSATHYVVRVNGIELISSTNSTTLTCPTATGDVTYAVWARDDAARESEPGTTTVNFPGPMGGAGRVAEAVSDPA